MTLAVIEQLIRDATGIDSVALGASAVERAVLRRQRIRQIPDLPAYCAVVSDSAVEFQALIDGLVVAETWFFRDAPAFAALAAFVRSEWGPANASGTLRLLSLPCATGEEPYSMAMALLDAGVPAGRFHIDAVDISQRALVRARQGEFGRASFRGDFTVERSRHFTKTAHGWTVADEVARQVQFHHGNVFSPALLPGVEPYDVIFCRNLLIYFDPVTQGRAIDVVSTLLKPRGVVFVGPSEPIALMNRGFVAEGTRGGFGLRKGEPALRLVSRQPAVPPVIARAADPRASADVARFDRPDADAADNGDAHLSEAMRLANLGRHGDAVRACTAAIQDRGPSAAAFYLLGLLHDAEGDTLNAMSCYRKVLFIDPHHEDAATHLALLLETLGRKAEAEQYRSMIRRSPVAGTQ